MLSFLHIQRSSLSQLLLLLPLLLVSSTVFIRDGAVRLTGDIGYYVRGCILYRYIYIYKSTFESLLVGSMSFELSQSVDGSSCKILTQTRRCGDY